MPRNMPVIFICSKDYHRTLEEVNKYAETFAFSHPTMEEQYNWCQTIASLNGNKVTPSIIQLIIDRSENDIRQLTNNMLSLVQEQNSGKNLIYIRKLLRESGIKESERHLFTLLHDTIARTNSVETSLKNYEAESILLPWMLFENVYRYMGVPEKQYSAKIAHLVAHCDMLWEFSHGHQAYEIEKHYAALSCWGIPQIYQKVVLQHLRKKVKPSFPSIMIKRSQMKLNENYNHFLSTKNLESNDVISYAALMLDSSTEDEICAKATALDIDFVTTDRIFKLRNSYYSKWSGNFRKKLKKKMEQSE